MIKFVAASILFMISGIALAQQSVTLPSPTSTGVVVPDRTVTLAAKIVGRVVAVNAEEGDRVAAGDVMVDIADPELRANLSAAGARLRMEELNPQERAHPFGQRLRGRGVRSPMAMASPVKP